MASSHRRAATSWHDRMMATCLPVIGAAAVVVAGVGAAQHSDDPSMSSLPTVQATGLMDTAAIADDLIARASGDATDVSRSAIRQPLPDVAAAQARVTKRLVVIRDDVKIQANHTKASTVLATIDKGGKVAVTGTEKAGFVEIIHKGLPRWVRRVDVASALPKPRPRPQESSAAPPAAVTAAPCPRGSAVEAGLLPDTVKVYRAVCNAFPGISSFGGLRGDGEHGTGQALDIMVNSELGDEIAAYLQRNQRQLGIEYLIWKQRIWRPATSPDWRGMSDRGGVTANHYDHVHVTTVGNAATS